MGEIRKTYKIFAGTPIIVREIKSRRMMRSRHVARMRRGKVFTGFWLGGPKVRNY